MAQYRSYKVDEKSNPKDDITLEIVATIPGKYGTTYICRAMDGDTEVGFTLSEQKNGIIDFVSEGELTTNFVKLLAKLFGKDFDVTVAAEKVKITKITKDDDSVKCSIGREKNIEPNLDDVFAQFDEILSLGLPEEELEKKRAEYWKLTLERCKEPITKVNYAEFFLHMNLDAKQVGFAQKDRNYQLPILRLLTGTPEPD